MRWTDGCTPRVTVISCEEDLQAQVRWSKGITVVSQAFFVLSSLRGLLDRKNRSGVGLAQLLVLTYSSLGVVNSLSQIVPFPADASQEAGLMVLEFVYSLYNATLIGSLAYLNRIWLELFVAEAYPAAGALVAAYARGARVCGAVVLCTTVAVALTADTVLAASPLKSTYDAVVHAQHFSFMLICLACSLASVLVPRRLLRELEQANGAAPAPEALQRVLVGRLLVAFMWMFCAFFCVLCALGGSFSNASNPNMVLAVGWAMHASFIFMGGGAIASLTYVMLHRPGTLDALARLLCSRKGA